MQTPKAVVKVDSATEATEMLQGHVMMDWQGHMYVKHE